FQEKISTIFQVAPSRALLDFSRFFLDFLRQQARSDSRAFDRAKAPFLSVPKKLLTSLRWPLITSQQPAKTTTVTDPNIAYGSQDATCSSGSFAGRFGSAFTATAFSA